MRQTVFLMNSRAPQNPNKVPFKVQMPLNLKNSVTGKGTKLTERGCLYEISLVMACLKQNDFQNKMCAKEVTSFHECYSTYLTNKRTAREQAHKGILTPNAKSLKYNQINLLLRKYPHV